jgi:hypothetical protein
MPHDRTVICLSLAAVCILGLGVLLYTLGAYVTPPSGVTPPRPLISTAAPARSSGQDIAMTCARKARVDLSPGALITAQQVQEMEVCAQQMLTIMRTP